MPVPRIHKENSNKIHFLTFTTIEWIDIFTKPQYFELIISSFKYCQKHKGLLLHGFVIMTNHIYSIMAVNGLHYGSSPVNDEDLHYGSSRETGANGLDEIIASFKKFTTMGIKRLLQEDNRKYILSLTKNSYSKKKGASFQIWQRENYPEIIETEKFFLQKLNYMHTNPVEKGYVIRPEDWLYSSARSYLLDDDSLIKIDKLL